MMIDSELRQRLSQDLRRLVTGRMTNDQFDNACEDNYDDAIDLAVTRIAEFGYCLYSSDLPFPYRLRGRHALSASTRRTAARCVLFLRTEYEYEWPEYPPMPFASFCRGLAFPFGVSLGIALLICSVPMLLMQLDGTPLFVGIALAGFTTLASSLWYSFGRIGNRSVLRSPNWVRWRNSGDYDVWPFRQREEFYAARMSVAVLHDSLSAE
jgi:hypothetical protein